MNLTGKELASLCVEEDKKPYFTICQLNWYQLLNDFMFGNAYEDFENNKVIEKFETKYITISNLKLQKEAIIKIRLKVSTKAIPQQLLDENLEMVIRIRDFYNTILQLFIDLLKKYNTTICLDLVSLEIINGKPITQVKIFSTNSSNFKDYFDIIQKYSMEDISLKKDEEYEYYYTDMEINSLDFLPKMYNELLNVGNHIEGIIFDVIEDWYYKLEIYDGCRE